MGQSTGTKTDSVSSLIDSGAWRSALATTYTLSLTYLESHVLPRLRKQGCQSLTVFADAHGYRHSFMEQRARLVGKAYSVVPVKVRRGIFHPKLVHLWAQDGGGDLLLVGSGNLTYSGHGGNIEVLEVLRAHEHARAFAQAADFFEGLTTSPRVDIRSPEALRQTAQRLRSLAAAGNSTQDVQFIHSLHESGLEQFVRAAQQDARPWRELLVLSPYHHPKAEPVRRILEETKVRRLAVGVTAKARETCSFPFHEKKSLRLRELLAVAPTAEKSGVRSLHAKWFELRRPGDALMLTGSFNATVESLTTTDNVECAVLRRADQASECWSETKPPAYAPDDFRRPAESSHDCLVARMESPNRIEGALVGATGCDGVWQASLETADDVLAQGEVQVDARGCFVWSTRERIQEARADTLQLSLHAGDRHARGWVQVSRVLNLQAHERSVLQALTQLGQGTQNDDDVVAVLDFVVHEFAMLLGTQPPQSRAAVAPATDVASQPAPSAGSAAGAAARDFDAGEMLDALEHRRGGWSVLSQVCAALMALPREARSGGSGRPGAAAVSGRHAVPTPLQPEDEESTDDAVRLKRELDRAARKFEQQLKEAKSAYRKASTSQGRVAAELARMRMLVVASHVELRFRLLELDDVEQTQAYLWQWFRQACDLRLPRELRAGLDSQVCGVAAAAALMLFDRTRPHDVARPDDFTKEPKHVHRCLDRHFAGQIAGARVVEQARQWLDSTEGERLTDGRIDEALEALQLVLSEPTERQLIAAVLRDGLAAHASTATRLLGEHDTAELGRLMATKGAGRKLFSQVDLRTLASCPACARSLLARAPDSVLELESELEASLARESSLPLRPLAVRHCGAGRMSSTAGPLFVAAHAEESSGVDYLGLRAINLNMMDLLLPGINNVVSLVRPYSLIAWTAWRYQQAPHGTAEGYRRFREKVEALFVWSHVEEDDAQGLPGVRQRDSGAATLTFEFKDFSRKATITDAAQYGPSLKVSNGLGFVYSDDGVLKPTTAGEELAKGLDARLRRLSPWQYEFICALEETRAPRDKLDGVVRAWQADSASAAERAAFAGRLYRPADIGQRLRHASRFAVVHLVLQLLREAGEPLTVNQVRERMAVQALPAALLSHPALSVFRDVRRSWQYLQVRQAQRLALEALFGWVERCIFRGEARSIDELVDVSVDAFKRDSDFPIADEAGYVRQALTFYAQSGADVDTLFEHGWADRARLDIFAAMRQLEKAGTDFSTSSSMALRAFVLALQCAVFAAAFARGESCSAARVDAFRFRVPLYYWGQVVYKLETLPLREFVRKVFETFIVSQHLGIAAARSGDQRSRMRLSIEDRGIVSLLTNGRKVLQPQRTSDRLGTALALMAACGLARSDGPPRLTEAPRYSF